MEHKQYFLLMHKKHSQVYNIENSTHFVHRRQVLPPCEILQHAQHLEMFCMCPLFTLTVEREWCLTEVVTDDCHKTGVHVTGSEQLKLHLF